jgi:hypothetical protein
MDPEITVKVTTGGKSKSSGSKLDRQVIRTISIKNLKSTDVKITVAGAMPVSEIEEVSVKLDGGTHPDRHDRRKGHLEWDVDLATGKETTLRHVYRMVGPAELVNSHAVAAQQQATVPIRR